MASVGNATKNFLHAKFAMAEKIIQFKAKKEIFDKAASDLACSVCKIVPKDVPIFQTGEHWLSR